MEAAMLHHGPALDDDDDDDRQSTEGRACWKVTQIMKNVRHLVYFLLNTTVCWTLAARTHT